MQVIVAALDDPLALRAMKVAVDGLNEADSVAITTYAGDVRVVLPPTPAAAYEKIVAAITKLIASGPALSWTQRQTPE